MAFVISMKGFYMKKLGVSTIEFVLIGALVAIVTLVFWDKISSGIINLAGLSSVKFAH